MKKLVYILNQYSDNEGSHLYHVINLLENIANKGVQIVLVIEKSNDIPIFNSNNISVIIQKKTGLKRLIEMYIILLNLRKLGFKKFFIRISQFGAIPAIFVSKIYGGDVYYWQSGLGHSEEINKSLNLNKIKWYLRSKLPFDFVKKYVDYFVTGPEFMLSYYESEVGVKSDKLLCLYNDIDISRFSKVDKKNKVLIRKGLCIENDKKIILYVKRLSKIKGVLFYLPYIIEKNAELLRKNNYECYILGDGSERRALELLIREKHLEDIIKIVGNKPNKEIQHFYQAADIFINPTMEEGFPRVLLEAMASGLPVVTTNSGGIPDMIGVKQRSLMVDKMSRDDFSIKLKELILDLDLQHEIAEENLQQVMRFSTERVSTMYINKIFK